MSQWRIEQSRSPRRWPRRRGPAPRGWRRERAAGGRPSDAFGGDIRRRDVFPLLVLHLIAREPTYGNRLIESIEEITEGAISVNPNTMYPLLREMEGRGPDRGPLGAPRPAHAPLLLDHRRPGRREYERLRSGGRAVPRLGDPLGLA